MTITDYQKFADEIVKQKDITIALWQFNKLHYVFVQDVWLETQPGFITIGSVRSKVEIMFELAEHFIK